MTRTLITPLHRPTLLSTLWIVLMFNYIYADVLGLNDPAHLIALESGTIGGLPFSPDKLVAAGLLMQVPIAMVLLSRVLRQTPNRVLNMLAAAFMAVTQVATLFFGTPPTPVYYLFSAIEIILLVVILVVAAAWRRTAPATVPDKALATA
ncbi:DUF6326 family protein [Cryobacterium psychrophilum]|uniref:DUF4345 domain-containing protein n=1 Tax=Cryobacterium psychrophilum TaxID=41988 RepID=A0A4Y8KM21_9MICO|nr:DUF6326 family protein [Cryobacterium psychrophilum]TDW31093.1 hypothetical protein EDD25_2885 [Cryobacterium psychrophilum]TFD78607.1 hypothetical protein E3T53_10550 [Cryobacterium psychrophilum]